MYKRVVWFLPVSAGLLLSVACGLWVVLGGNRARDQNCEGAVRRAVAMVEAENAVFNAVAQCGPRCADVERVRGLMQDAKQARIAFVDAAGQCLK